MGLALGMTVLGRHQWRDLVVIKVLSVCQRQRIGVGNTYRCIGGLFCMPRMLAESWVKGVKWDLGHRTIIGDDSNDLFQGFLVVWGNIQ